jgi:hypothetical protein
MDTYASEEKLMELHHNYTTQGNEAMNTSIASYAPKTKTYSTTMSLHNRVKMAAAIQIVGEFEYWNKIYGALGMEMSEDTAHFNESQDTSKDRAKRRTEQTDVRRKRQEQFYEKIKKAIEADERAKRKGLGTYRSGVAINDRSNMNEFREVTIGAGPPLSEQQPCIDCGEYDHKTSRSKKCEKNEKFDPTTAAKRCPDCDRRGHSSSRSQHCPKHPLNVPANDAPTLTGHVDESAQQKYLTSHQRTPMLENKSQEMFLWKEQIIWRQATLQAIVRHTAPR